MTSELKDLGKVRPRRGGKSTFLLAWALLSALTIAWSLATPISASPDEPAHTVKAASVVRGEFIGASSSHGNIVDVPKYVAWTNLETCYARAPQVTASCIPPVPGDEFQTVASTTSAGLYNPVYYLLVGWPSLIFQSNAGIYAMRAISAVLTSLFGAWSIWLVSYWRRPKLPLLAVSIVTTPMLLFLAGTVNPNAVEVTGTMAVLVSALGLVRGEHGPSRYLQLAVLTVSATVAGNSRGLSLVWVAAALGIALIFANWSTVRALARQRAVLISVGIVALSSIFALAWVVATSSLTTAVTNHTAVKDYPGVGSSPVQGFLTTLSRTIEYTNQLIGIFGWMDTPSPAEVLTTWIVAISALVFAGLCVARGRALVALVVALSLFILCPPILQGAYVTAGGYIWQGRYNLPLFACLVIIAAVATSTTELVPSRRIAARGAVMGLSLLAAAQVFAFVFVLKRYGSGIGSTWGTFLTSSQWQAPGTNVGLIALFATLVAASSVCLYRLAMSRPAKDYLAQTPISSDGPPDVTARRVATHR